MIDVEQIFVVSSRNWGQSGLKLASSHIKSESQSDKSE